MDEGKKRNSPFGMIAEFDDPDALVSAANAALRAGYTRMDAFTPFPVHDMPKAIGFDCAKVPWTIFAMGCVGALSGLGLQYWVSAVAYPHNIGGRPLFSWPLFIPVIFECMVLFAAIGAVFGMLMYNKLPRPHHPVFGVPNFDRATQDRFFLLVEANDPAYDEAEVKKLLESTQPLAVNAVREDEEGDWS